MSAEFEKIMNFFSLDSKEKEGRLNEVFEDSLEYFERFKHTMLNGTPEEKQKAFEEVMLIKKRIEEESHRISEATGFSEEELETYSNNPNNFTPQQWDAIKGAKERVEEGVREIKKAANLTGEDPAEEGEKPKKPRKPKKWIPS